MAKKEAQPATIKIDDVEYKLDDLSDNAKAQLQNIQFSEAEMQRLNMLLALSTTARNAYTQALKADLPVQEAVTVN